MANAGHPIFSEIKLGVIKPNFKKKKKSRVEVVVLECDGSNSQIQRLLEKILLQAWSNGSVEPLQEFGLIHETSFTRNIVSMCMSLHSSYMINWVFRCNYALL